MCNSHQIPQADADIRPKMLKELLADDPYSNSVYFINNKLLRTKSKAKAKAALTKMYALRKAFKYLQFSTAKYISEKCQNHHVEENSTTVKVKDILRWRSFRDEKPPLLDFDIFSSPHHCTTATTTTGTTSTGSNSCRSSLCDSDFTYDDSYSDLYSAEVCKNDKSNQLFSDFEEEEEANAAIQRAKAVVDAVEVITSEFEMNTSVDQLLFHLFRDELTDDCINDTEAKNWASRKDEECLEWKYGGSKELCISEMEWGNFEDEKQSLAMEMENVLLSSLMDQLLIDFC